MVSTKNMPSKLGKPAVPEAIGMRPGLLVILTSTALAVAACGRTEIYAPKTVNQEDTPTLCSQTPRCPDVDLAWLPDYYNTSPARVTRIHPNDMSAHAVCDVAAPDYCLAGEDSIIDDCEPPICPDAVACDPLPTLPNNVFRYPKNANTPTNHIGGYTIPDNDRRNNPPLFDTAPDCQEGFTPDGESYFICDPIPTCPKDEQFKDICDPLPRCAEGQSPIQCNIEAEYYRFSDSVDCELRRKMTEDQLQFYFGLRGLGVDCEPLYFDDIRERGFAFPGINVVCLPTPECRPGEIPNGRTNTTVTMECNGVTWQATNLGPSCDPIPSCPQ